MVHYGFKKDHVGETIKGMVINIQNILVNICKYICKYTFPFLFEIPILSSKSFYENLI